MALKKIRGAHIRKINHYRRIISKTLINIRQVWPGDIIEFRYRGTDIFDSIPLIFVIKKEQKIIQGLNLNYLKEHNVQKIFDEPDWIRLNEGKVRRDVKGSLFRNLRNWIYFEDAYRTYSVSKLSMIHDIKYKTDAILEEEREQKQIEIKKEDLKNLDENKL